MEPSTTENLKKRKLISYAKQNISTYLKHVQALFHTNNTVVGCSRSIQVANVQEFFSLKMSYDVFWCFTSISYHRHAENVLSKVDIACGQMWAIRAISLQWWSPPNLPVDATVFFLFVTS